MKSKDGTKTFVGSTRRVSDDNTTLPEYSIVERDNEGKIIGRAKVSVAPKSGKWDLSGRRVEFDFIQRPSHRVNGEDVHTSLTWESDFEEEEATDGE